MLYDTGDGANGIVEIGGIDVVKTDGILDIPEGLVDAARRDGIITDKPTEGGTDVKPVQAPDTDPDTSS